jgi:hypothetical protein
LQRWCRGLQLDLLDVAWMTALAATDATIDHPGCYEVLSAVLPPATTYATIDHSGCCKPPSLMLPPATTGAGNHGRRCYNHAPPWTLQSGGRRCFQDSPTASLRAVVDQNLEETASKHRSSLEVGGRESSPGVRSLGWGVGGRG